MAYVLNVDIVDEDGSIHVTHHFWGQTEEEVRGYYEEHQDDCDYLSDAVEDDRAIEELKLIPDADLPQPEEEEAPEVEGEPAPEEEADGDDVDS